MLTTAILVGGYFGYERWDKRPQVIKSLYGITLGETLSDVTFKKGPFVKRPRDSSLKQHDDEEHYSQVATRLNIMIRNGIVTHVWYVCDSKSDFTKVNNVTCGDSGESIESKFGNMTRVLCAKAPAAGAVPLRVYDIPRFGTRYGLTENRVGAFIVMTPNALESAVGINWDKCP